jgi:hypothetical protein
MILNNGTGNQGLHCAVKAIRYALSLSVLFATHSIPNAPIRRAELE